MEHVKVAGDRAKLVRLGKGSLVIDPIEMRITVKVIVSLLPILCGTKPL